MMREFVEKAKSALWVIEQAAGMIAGELNERARERLAAATEDRPPSPDAVALVFAQALLQSKAYDNPQDAIAAAWWAVPAFYQWRETYAEKIAPQFFAPVNMSGSEEINLTVKPSHE